MGILPPISYSISTFTVFARSDKSFYSMIGISVGYMPSEPFIFRTLSYDWDEYGYSNCESLGTAAKSKFEIVTLFRNGA